MLQGPNQDIEYSPDYRSAKWRNSSWNNGNIPDMNVKDPPLKDTVVIPYKGYVVLRLKTENPGIFPTLEPYLFFYLRIFHMKIILKMLDTYLTFLLKNLKPFFLNRQVVVVIFHQAC